MSWMKFLQPVCLLGRQDRILDDSANLGDRKTYERISATLL